VILAPFNSTLSDLSGFFRSMLEMAKMEDKREVLKFAARCRDQDRQYEINNNAELDNGVYHKFVYSSKDEGDDQKNQQRAQLLSRNSSRRSLDDLTQAKKKKTDKTTLQAERDALKADIRKGIRKFE
jgi:hypothetical protein